MLPFKFWSANMPATEQIRKENRSLLLDASQTLEEAFWVHDYSVVREVQNAVQQQFTLFKEFDLSACDLYPYFNANGLLLDSTSWILINICTTVQSDCRFSRLHDVLDLGIKLFSDCCFGHENDQFRQVINNLQSVKQTLLFFEALHIKSHFP